MIEPIQVNVLQCYVNRLVPQYYRTTGTGTDEITTPTLFKLQSTMIFIDNVYQPFASYVEGSDNETITFDDVIAIGQDIEVRYNLLGT